MKVIREYLLNDTDLLNYLGGQYLWLVEKPDKVKADPYIIYKYKELNGGFIKDYQIEFNIIGSDLSKLLSIKFKLIDLLDDPRGEKQIKDNEAVVRHSKLLNGGGMTKNPNTGNFEIIVFFLCKI